MNELQMRKTVVLSAVQRQIFCSVNNTVLDINNAYLVTNRDNGKACIMSGEAWDKIREHLPANFSDTLEVWVGKTGEEL